MIRSAFRVAFVLWAGSLWSLAAWVAPSLFSAGDRHFAGTVAGRLFSIETYLTLAVAGWALALPERGRFHLLYVAAALLLINEWVLKRLMSLAQQGYAAGLSFGAWHGMSAVLYVFACVAALVLVWRSKSA